MTAQPTVAQAAPAAPPRARQVIRAVRTSPTLRLIGLRAASAVLVVWGVTLASFAVMNLLPGDAAQELLGMGADPSQVRALEVTLHLDEPFWTRYGQWLGNAVRGDLGSSLQNQVPVASVIAQRLPVTLEIVVLAFVISLAASVAIGTLAARRPNGPVDRISMVASMLSLSVAPYVLALIMVLVFAVRLSWLPAIGWTPLTESLPANWRSAALPALSLGLALVGLYTRLLRADMVDQVSGEEYVVTARAKGVRESQILARHVLPNSMFPLITVAGLNFGRLIEGTVVIETIFGIPGIGQELVQAVQVRDIPVVQGVVVVMAIIVVAANLAADLLYSVLDPRIRHARSAA